MPRSAAAAAAVCCLAAALSLPRGAALVAPPCDALAIDSPSPVNTLPSYFASWNVDASRQRSFFDVNFSDARLTYLASQISGANLRFGGTGNDFIYYEVPGEPSCPPTVPYVNECLNASLFAGVAAIASAARAGLVFGLSLLPFNATYRPDPYPRPVAAWTWDSTNAAALLRAAKASGTPLWGLELGNEVLGVALNNRGERQPSLTPPPPFSAINLGRNSKGFAASQQAAALFNLSAVLDDVYGAGPDRPVLVGPDPSGFHVPLPDSHSASVLACALSRRAPRAPTAGPQALTCVPPPAQTSPTI